MSRSAPLRQFRFMKFLPLFAVNAFWFCISFPARLSPDSITILSNVKNQNWSSIHTIAYEYFVFVTSFGGRCIWITILVQLTLLSASVYFLIKTISIKFNKVNEVLITSAILISPYGGGIASAIWADSLNSSMVILFIALAFRFQSFTKKGEYLVFFFIALLGTQFRKESFIVEVLIVVILIFFFSLSKFVLLKIIAISLLAISIGIGFTALTIDKVEKFQSPIWTNYQVMVGDLVNYSRITDDISIDNFVETFASKETVVASSDCQNIFSVVFSPGFRDGDLEKIEQKIIVSWIRESLLNLQSFILVHNCRAGNFLPPPLGSPPQYVYWISPGQIPNELGYAGQTVIRVPVQVSNLVWNTLQTLGLFVFWPGFIIFIALILGFRVNQKPEIKTLLTAAIAHGFLMYVFAPAPDFRLGMLPSLLCLVVISLVIADYRAKHGSILIWKNRKKCMVNSFADSKD